MKRGRPYKEIPTTTTPPRNGTYYTIPEAVELTGLHRHTLQAYLRDGRLNGKIIGGKWHIYKEELYTGD